MIGQPDPQVHWTNNGKKLRPGIRERMKLENGLATLEISGALTEDSGYYACIANNSYGQSSTEALVRVYAGFETMPLLPTFTSSMKGYSCLGMNEYSKFRVINNSYLNLISQILTDSPTMS